MKYFEHPLNKISEGVQQQAPDCADLTPENFMQTFFPTPIQQIKNSVGNVLYPVKNKLEYKKSLRLLGLTEQSFTEKLLRPDTITLGKKGGGIEVFYSNIKKQIPVSGTVINFGCGLGWELILTAKYLQPKKIIGCEYFNYGRAWEYVKKYVMQRYGIEVEFYQVDLRNPIPDSIPRADLLISYTVLEHLKEMDNSLSRLKEFLKPNGHFASLWGPMWYSYTGDHIAAELGHEHGFDHVLLDAKEYMEFYKNHPRNKSDFERGIKTWLELGLSNFALFEEYMESITRIYGKPNYIIWQLSKEAFAYKEKYPENWKKILHKHPFLNENDLIITSAGVVV